MAEPLSATEELARLVERYAEASGRIDDLERTWRSANETLAQARAALIELERRGGSAAERGKLEKQLVDAEAAAAQPWRERVEGARQAAHDLDVDRRQHVAENLDELVKERESAGWSATEEFNRDLEGLVAKHQAWSQVASEITALAAVAGRTQPGDVTRTKAEQLMREVAALLLDGGENPPALLRDPRQPRHPHLAESGQAVSA